MVLLPREMPEVERSEAGERLGKERGRGEKVEENKRKVRNGFRTSKVLSRFRNGSGDGIVSPPVFVVITLFPFLGVASLINDIRHQQRQRRDRDERIRATKDAV